MSSDEASLQVDLAEFNALRAEIQTFITCLLYTSSRI